MVITSKLRILLQNKQYIFWLEFLSTRCIEILDELPEGTCHMPLTAQHIRYIKIFQVPILQEEVSQIHQSHQTLQCRVHIASITKILQTHLATKMEVLHPREDPFVCRVVLNN